MTRSVLLALAAAGALSCGGAGGGLNTASEKAAIDVTKLGSGLEQFPKHDKQIRPLKNLLFLSHGMSPRHLWLNDDIEGELAQRGWAVSWQGSFAKLQLRDAALKYKYHVVVVHAMALGALSSGDLCSAADALEAYVKAGGGLLVTTSNYVNRDVLKWNAILKRFGKTEMVAEGICETNSGLRYTNYPLNPNARKGFEYSWTDSFNAKRFGTGGDMGPLPTGLYYLNNHVQSKSPATVYVRTVPPWSHLLRSSATGYAYNPAEDYTACGEIPAVKGVDKKGNPVLQNKSSLDLVSTLDKYGPGGGRVAAWPMHLATTLIDGYSPLLEEGVVMDSDNSKCKGCKQGAQASQGALLMYSLLDWLAIPSYYTANAGFANATVRESSSVSAGSGQPARDWNLTKALAGPAPYGQSYRGFIGARAGFSRKKMETFVKKAKAADYAFIAFAEDVNHAAINDPDPVAAANAWKDFVHVCDSLSLEYPPVQVFPGILYADYEGTEFVAWGVREWPGRFFHTKDGRHPNIAIHNTKVGNPSVVMLSEASRIPEPSDRLLSARLKAAVHGFAVHVTDGGKTQVAWDADTYLHLQKSRHRLYPTVVHKTSNPDDVAKLEKNYQAFIRSASPIHDLVREVSSVSSLRAGYVSRTKGPEILQLWAVNGRNADVVVPSLERIRLKAAARASNNQALKVVEIFDNGRLYRRFLPGNASSKGPTWETVIDDYHSHQHSFVIRAQDSKGDTALSWAMNTSVRQYYQCMQTDNLNTVEGGDGWDSGKRVLRHTEWYHSAVREPRMGGFPRAIPRHVGEKQTIPGVLATMSDCGMVSRFGSLCSFPLNYIVPAVHLTGNGLRTDGEGGEARGPNEWYEGTYRRMVFARRPPGPRTYILEYDIRFKKALSFKTTPGLPLAISSQSSLPPGQLDRYVVNSGGTGAQGTLTSLGTNGATGAMKAGDDIAIYPMLASIASVDGGVYYHVFSTASTATKLAGGHLAVGIKKSGDSAAAGESLSVRLAGAQLPYAQGEYHGDLNPRSFDPKDTANSSVAALKGWRKDLARYPQTAPDGICYLMVNHPVPRFGKAQFFPQSDWPLPVMFSGLNPNWSAGIWYVGTGNHLRTGEPSGGMEGEPSGGMEYVVAEEKTDEIIYIGAFTDENEMWGKGVESGTGLLQLDLTMGGRQVFIGNFVTCSREDFRVTFHKECPGTIGPVGKGLAQCIEIHNPTDKDDTVDVATHPDFTLFSSRVEKGLTVKAGQTEVVFF